VTSLIDPDRQSNDAGGPLLVSNSGSILASAEVRRCSQRREARCAPNVCHAPAPPLHDRSPHWRSHPPATPRYRPRESHPARWGREISLLARLDRYLEQRQRAGAPTDPDAPLLWSPRRGSYSRVGVRHGISRLLRLVCGKRRGHRGHGSHVHDIRQNAGSRIMPGRRVA
jgi:hypothetical protein